MESFWSVTELTTSRESSMGACKTHYLPLAFPPCCNARYQVLAQIKQLPCSSALLNVTNITVNLYSWNHGWDISNKFRWGDNNYDCGATALSAQIMRSLPLQEVLMIGLIPVEH